MQTLIALGSRVPDDVAIVGFDDVKYALLLAVPLTTVQQPCRDLGRVAVNALLDRIAQPDLPPRTILLESSVIVAQVVWRCLNTVRQKAGGPSRPAIHRR